MNNRHVLQLPVLIAAITALAGCLGGHVPALPETQRQAEAALTRGIRAEHKGDYGQAEQFLEQSRTLSSSVEDTRGAAIALINLSRLKRLRGEPEKAADYIDRALLIANADSPLAAEAYYEKALVELARGSAATALPWAEKARAAENGDARGSRSNLSARIHLMLGRLTEAEELAGTGYRESRSAGQDEEAANGLRISGMAARERQRLDDSKRLLLEALEIDKRIGKSAKVSNDLEELARTAEKGGRRLEAAGYLERAVEVHRAGGRSHKAEALSSRITELKSMRIETPPVP